MAVHICSSVHSLPMKRDRRDAKTLERLYERDKETGAFIIGIALDKYPDVFNELDSAPWRRRDLDYDLRVFLEESSSDIPRQYDILLQFNVFQEKQDVEKEDRIKAGLKTYFTFVRSSLQREIRSSYQKSAVYVLASLMLLFTSYTLQAQVMGNLVFATLVDAISIGGWVFLWEAISTFAFTNRNKQEQYQQYKRLSIAPVRFYYYTNQSNAS
ncbi:MAG: hypothetical protein NWF00_02440 [Candidatus Bathyarchaeota archaeon]|nr:hypothetical protein [Candidatus Bathyarchaeota archaeon]